MSDVVLNRASLAAADLPTYSGLVLDPITQVTSDTKAGKALDALMASDAIGFDTKSKPTSLKGEAAHLHGVNLLSGKSHLEPWIIGAVRDSVLHKLATSRSAIRIILEIRDIGRQEPSQPANRVNQKPNYFGWHSEQS